MSLDDYVPALVIASLALWLSSALPVCSQEQEVISQKLNSISDSSKSTDSLSYPQSAKGKNGDGAKSSNSLQNLANQIGLKTWISLVASLLAIGGFIWKGVPYVRGLLGDHGAYWLCLKESNAVVLESLEDCKRYLERHFQSWQGEIAIYNSDLFGIINDNSFESFYHFINGCENVERVLMLIPKSRICKIKDPEVWAKLGKKLTEAVPDNRAKGVLRKNTLCDKICYKILEQEEIIDERLKNYPNWDSFVQNDCFIFYTSGTHDDARTNAVFIHRVSKELPSGDSHGLRVTVVGSSKKTDAVGKFIPSDAWEIFNSLFWGRKGGWRKLYELAEDRRRQLLGHPG